MKYIDAFNHFFPKQIWDKMLASGGIARVMPATPNARRPSYFASCCGVGGLVKSTVRTQPRASDSSASVEPVKSSP